MSRFGLAEIFIKEALRQPGCPLCRCRRQNEERYLRFLIWENVNDVETRIRLVSSLGLCREHAEFLFDLEQGEHGFLLGNSILYESLIGLVAGRVRKLLGEMRPASADYPRTLRERLAARLKPSQRARPHPLAPTEPCRACEIGSENEALYVETLLDMLREPRFQAMYAASDGLCLAHLRLATETAEQPEGMAFVLQQTAQRLETLRDQLTAYIGKQVYPRDEGALTEAERTAAARAIAFLAGEAR